MTVDPAAVARGYLEAFASGDPETVAACVTDDFVNDHASSLGSGCAGRDEYRRRLPGFLASMPGLRYDVESTTTEGARVATAYRLTATVGEHPIDIRGLMLIDVDAESGLVAKRTDYWDALTYLKQTAQA